MTTNSKIKTYSSYDEIPKRRNHQKGKITQVPYQFLKKFYGIE